MYKYNLYNHSISNHHQTVAVSLFTILVQYWLNHHVLNSMYHQHLLLLNHTLSHKVVASVLVQKSQPLMVDAQKLAHVLYVLSRKLNVQSKFLYHKTQNHVVIPHHHVVKNQQHQNADVVGNQLLLVNSRFCLLPIELGLIFNLLWCMVYFFSF